MKERKYYRELSIVTFFICILVVIIGYFYTPKAEYEVSNDMAGESEQDTMEDKYTSMEEENSSHTIDFPPLIQTITSESEYLGLLHLGMLEQTSESIPTGVGIKAGNYMGCGSILSMSEEEIILVSCKHLLQYGYDVEVTFFDSSKALGQVTYLSDQFDVAFAKIEIKQIAPDTLVKLRYLKIDENRFSTLQEGDSMFLLGLEAGGYSTRTGSIANPSEYFVEFNSFMIRNHCEGEPGMSGGGTFDENGNYLGLLVGGLLEDTATLSYEVILQEYEHMLSINSESKNNKETIKP